MTIALVLLVALVALGRGGYQPWGTFALQAGSAVLVFVAVTKELLGGSEEERARQQARYRAWKRLPGATRHPFVAICLRALTLGRWPRRGRGSTADVEILLPGGGRGEDVDLDPSRETFVLGVPLKRTGLGVPLLLLALWIALSLVPLSRGALRLLTPEAERLRSEAEALVGAAATSAPWSLAPFLAGRDLWIWIAVCGLFWIAVSRARRSEGASRLGLCLLGLAAFSGVYGLAGWFGELHEALGLASASLRARGSFGNPNHYAAFQSMLLLVGLGWLGAHRAGAGRAPRRDRWNEGGLALIAGLGLLLAALGLVLSLSRSGLASCLAGAAAFVLLARGEGRASNRPRPAGARALAALVLAVIGFTVWIGIEPLVGRFASLDEQWEVEGTRLELWSDSLPAVGDFWVTGAGLGSFRYVGAIYRDFGGRAFFSWAHNDYLQLAIELGLPGLALLAWIVVAVVRGSKRVRADLAGAPDLQHLHAGFVAAIVAVAVHSATDFSLHLPANLAVLAVVTGGAVGMEAPGRGFRQGARVTRDPSRPPRAGSPPSRSR